MGEGLLCVTGNKSVNPEMCYKLHVNRRRGNGREEGLPVYKRCTESLNGVFMCKCGQLFWHTRVL